MKEAISSEEIRRFDTHGLWRWSFSHDVLAGWDHDGSGWDLELGVGGGGLAGEVFRIA